MGKARYAWITGGPLTLLAINTLWGAFLNIRDNYYPMATGIDNAVQFQGWVLTLSSVIIMICALVILVASIRKWVEMLGASPGAATESKHCPSRTQQFRPALAPDSELVANCWYSRTACRPARLTSPPPGL